VETIASNSACGFCGGKGVLIVTDQEWPAGVSCPVCGGKGVMSSPYMAGTDAKKGGERGERIQGEGREALHDQLRR
jgi:DnaJ-class molecular chaperone